MLIEGKEPTDRRAGEKARRMPSFMSISEEKRRADAEMTAAISRNNSMMARVTNVGLMGIIFFAGIIFHARITEPTEMLLKDWTSAVLTVFALFGGGALVRNQLFQKQAETWEKMYRQADAVSEYQQQQIEDLFTQQRIEKTERKAEIEAFKLEREKALEKLKAEHAESFKAVEEQYRDVLHERQTLIALNLELQKQHGQCEEENRKLRARIEHLEAEVQRLEREVAELKAAK